MDASYIGPPYFTPSEVLLLKSTIINNNNNKKTLANLIEETLNERLERRMKKRIESGDYRVCTAHGLAPIFEKVFDIKLKELAKDENFLGVMERSGLVLKEGEEWKGISRKSFQKKNKKR